MAQLNGRFSNGGGEEKGIEVRQTISGGRVISEEDLPLKAAGCPGHLKSETKHHSLTGRYRRRAAPRKERHPKLLFRKGCLGEKLLEKDRRSL